MGRFMPIVSIGFNHLHKIYIQEKFISMRQLEIVPLLFKSTFPPAPFFKVSIQCACKSIVLLTHQKVIFDRIEAFEMGFGWRRQPGFAPFRFILCFSCTESVCMDVTDSVVLLCCCVIKNLRLWNKKTWIFHWIYIEMDGPLVSTTIVKLKTIHQPYYIKPFLLLAIYKNKRRIFGRKKK